MVRGLGFHDADLDRPLHTFSGGELTRGSLARALAGDPALLLLDEPTNHLDVESLEWLEQRLTTIDAAVVLVAHDRWFLEAVGTAVLELEGGRGRYFAGPWHAWRKERAARELALGRAIERQEAEIARLERFVTRFRAGTRAKQAQSRAKKLDKTKKIDRDPRDGQVARVHVRGAAAQRARGARARERVAEGRRQGAAPRRRPVARARRARVARRAERRRQDDPDRHARRHARAREGQAPARAQRGDRLPVAARRGARIAGHRARDRRARDQAHAAQGTRAARPLPVLRRGGREAGRGALRRRAAAAVAGDPRPVRREPADPRRAHEPPRRRVTRGARGRAAGLPGDRPAGLARPRAAGCRRHPHDLDGGRRAALLRRRLGRVRPAAGGGEGCCQAGTGRGGQSAEIGLERQLQVESRRLPHRSRSRPAPRRTARSRSRRSSARSRPPRRSSLRSRTSWPTRRPGRRRRRASARRRSTPQRRARSSGCTRSSRPRAPSCGWIRSGEPGRLRHPPALRPQPAPA